VGPSDAPSSNPGATVFHPIIQAWFDRRYGLPTDIQVAAWRHIAAGEHLLITAPTGSGKTMAAFLWALHQLATGTWPVDRTSVLYVSPLRALNHDIERNLLAPLGELRTAFADAGAVWPEIRVATRSGDTDPATRQRLLRRPPSILITTPESLNLLLASPRGRDALRDLSTVILDEIHAVAGTRRGVHLMTAVERLALAQGEFQRLALSATVKPAAEVAAFVGGRQWQAAGTYAPRAVRVLASSQARHLQLRVCLPAAPPGAMTLADRLTPTLRQIIDLNRSTLVFVNSRRLSESLTAALNVAADEPRAYAHHGSLSREVRLAVESRLKAGRLRSIVATSSLELGIDIGALDEAVLVQAPPSVAATVQRIGRAGHQVGQTSRGTLLAPHPHDLLELAALVRAVRAGELEPTRPLAGPLDVLAQVIVGSVATEDRQPDELYDQVRCAWAYRDLSRTHFDLVVQMLCGHYAGTRRRELQPRLSLDPLTGCLRANNSGLQALRRAGGTIPDRGYYSLRHLESRARLGELDEEFVWENGPGSRFVFGNRAWRVEQVTANEVLVLPTGGSAGIPFWRAEEPSRSFHLAARIGSLLAACDDRLDDPELSGWLQAEGALEADAAQELVAYLSRQRAATGQPLPHRHHVLVEYVDSGPLAAAGHQIYVHAGWGRAVTRPWALALTAAWADRYGGAPEVYANNDGLCLVLPADITAEELVSLVTVDNLDPLLRRTLETSPFFGARFREAAGRALLLARGPAGRRTPLWLSRLGAQEVLDATAGLPDFPILLEAWRSCCQDDFDLPALGQMLTELATGRTALSTARRAIASPFARRDTWRQVNDYMYADEPSSRRPSQLRPDLVKSVVMQPDLRPQVMPEIVATLQAKLQRTAPGYGPQSSRELVDWVSERLLIPWDEWQAGWRRLPSDPDLAAELLPRLYRLEPVLASLPLVCTRHQWPALSAGLLAGHTVAVFGLDGAEVDAVGETQEPAVAGEQLAWWLSFYGPVTPAWIAARLGLTTARIQALLGPLVEQARLVAGQLVVDADETTVCDRRNLEALIRMARAQAVITAAPAPASCLAWLVADQQGLTQRTNGPAAVAAALTTLAYLPVPAAAWEEEILPARVVGYQPGWLDPLLADSSMTWQGCAPQRVAFAPAGDPLAVRPGPDEPSPSDWIPATGGRYPFRELQARAGVEATVLLHSLWTEVWQERAANDSFTALRAALACRFQFPQLSPLTRPHRGTWSFQTPTCFQGNWYARRPAVDAGDAVDRLETERERVRLVLGRYGLLCRALLEGEPPALRWSALFRPMRLMELAGELVAGTFIAGLEGLQFTRPAWVPRLAASAPGKVFWLSAADPASLCGLDLPLPERLPPRRVTTHLVYRGSELAMVSWRQGRALEFRLPPDHPDLAACCGVLAHLLTRPVRPLRRLCIATINDQPAAASPYLALLRQLFDAWVEVNEVVLHRRRPDAPAAVAKTTTGVPVTGRQAP
jgi:ATP-dependent Lhr-like helicase